MKYPTYKRLGLAVVALTASILWPALASATPQELAQLSDSALAKLESNALRAIEQGQSDGFLVLFNDQNQARLPFTHSSNRQQRNDRKTLQRARIADFREHFERVHSAKGARIQQQFHYLPLLKVELESHEALAELLNDDKVAAIVLDERLYPRMSQSLPLIDQPAASNYGYRGANQSVAVLDTGLDYTLNSFGNCTAPGIPASCRVAYVEDFAPEDNALDAGTTEHGTYVSAIVANTANEATLIGLDVFDGASALSSDIIAAIDWIIEERDTYNIGVANFSLGGTTPYTSPCNQPFNAFRSAFAELVANDILPVVAAGNEGWDNALASPACLSDALSVGATYDQTRTWIDWGICRDEPATVNKVACMSNSASFLDLLAPGAVISTEHFAGGGTSMAAPHVSAAAALLRSQFSNESQNEIRTRLLDSNIQITDSKNGLNLPFLDLSRALMQAHDKMAAALTLPTDTQTFSGNTGFAGVEPNEPGSFNQSLWYALNFSIANWYTATFTSTDPSMQINIYVGPDSNNLTLLTSLTQNASPLFPIQPGTNYWVQVGSEATGGQFELSLSVTAAPEPMSDEDIPLLPLWAIFLFGGLSLKTMRQRIRQD